MAKHPKKRGRSMRRYIKGNVDDQFTLGVLAANAIVTNLWDESVEQRTLISSVVLSWALSGITSPQGPLLFGLAHGDYTDAEIEEVIENIGSWDEGNLIAQEKSKRKVRVIGKFVVDSQLAGTVDVPYNGGKPVKTKLNWVLTDTDGITMWVYNVSQAALSTTDPEVTCSGHANLWVL